MGFLSEAKNESFKAKSINKLTVIKDQLNEKEFNEFIDACKDTTISSSAIAKVLKSRGIEVSESSIGRCRRAL